MAVVPVSWERILLLSRELKDWQLAALLVVA
jgi:hypothetical protein